MPVDTSEIKNVATELLNIVTGVLTVEYNANRLRGDQYANVISNAITSIVQSSSSIVQDYLLKEAQKDLIISQKNLVDSEKTIKENQSSKDIALKEAQKVLIEKQQLTEEKKSLLTVRQTTAYDDNLRIKEGELLSNVMGMFGAGGTTLPSGLSTAAFNAIARITAGGTSTTLADTGTLAT